MTGAFVVTGAASGIGRACALRLLHDGASVAALDRDADALRYLGDADRCLTIALDVRDATAVDAAVAAATAHFGALAGLVAAAGIERDAPVTQLSEADWDLVIDTNLKGTFLCARAMVNALRAAGGGTMVTFGSVLGRAALPGVAAYGASKAGIEALTRALAIDHAQDRIRCVCVVPGTTDTPLTWQTIDAAELDAVKREAAGEIPLGFVAEPDQIASVVAFLLSDGAQFITGTSLVVDGGLLAKFAASH